MVYERIAYMCPKCHQGHFYNNSEKFSTICSNCNVEMVCVEKKYISTEQKRKKKQNVKDYNKLSQLYTVHIVIH